MADGSDSKAPMWHIDRFVVLSLMEDLHLAEVPTPSEWNASSSNSLEARGGDGDDEPSSVVGGGNGDGSSSSGGLLSAGSAADVHEEPKSHGKARLRALHSLPALAARLGCRWAAAEVPSYLLRCVQEDDPELGRTVAMIIPSLVLHDYSSPPNSNAPVLLDPMVMLPVIVALCGASDAVTRHVCSWHTIPKITFGVSLVTAAALWEVHSPISAPTIFRETSAVAVAAAPGASPLPAAGGAPEDGVRSILKDVSWPLKSEQSDVPPSHTDPFDRALSIANVVCAIRDYTKQYAKSDSHTHGLAHGVLLLEALCELLSRSQWSFVAASKTSCLSLMVHALVHVLTISPHSETTPAFSLQPASDAQLRASIVWLASKHLLGCFCADKRFSSNPQDAVVWLMERIAEPTPSHRQQGVPRTPLIMTTSADSGERTPQLLLDGDVAAMDSRCTVAVIRALPHLVDPTAGSSRGRRLPTLLSLPSVCSALEQSLLQRQVRFGQAPPRLREEMRSYAQRHDDSFAGSSFAHFHAITDTLEGVLKRVMRLQSRGTVSGYRVSCEMAHRLVSVVRLYLARGTSYSLWKNRFFVVRRAVHIIEALVRIVQSEMVAAANADGDVPAAKALWDDTIALLHSELLGNWYPQLCGDGELEVRSVVAHHVVDPLLSITWLLVNAPDSLTPSGSTAADHVSRVLFRVAQDVVACTQVCVMDVIDRVRASAAASISRALALQAYGRLGVSSHRWAAIASTTESRKLTDALITLVMDLFRDDSHLVLLSVMETFGEVCLHQEPVDADGVADCRVDPASSPSSPLDGTSRNTAVQDIVLSSMEQELVALCKSLQSSPTWRVREAYASLISKLTGSFLRQISNAATKHGGCGGGGAASARRLHVLLTHTLLPMLVEVLFDSARAVRDAAVAAVVADLRLAAQTIGFERVMGFVNETFWPLVRQSQRGSSTYLFRESMLLVAVKLGVDLEQHVFGLLDQLSHDSVTNVRLVVARTVEEFLLRSSKCHEGASRVLSVYHVSDVQRTDVLLPLLRGLVEDSSHDVRQCASKALAACV